MNELDIDTFHRLLIDSIANVVKYIRDEYSDKQIFAFYLFHDSLWGYIVPHISVEDGIKPLPQSKSHHKMLVNRSFHLPPKPPKRPLQVHVLKMVKQEDGLTFIWTTKSVFDLSVTNSIGREYFEDVNMWLLRAQFYRVTFTHKQMEQYHRTMTAVAIDVLQALDKRGLFGDDDQRQHTLVNLVMLKDPNREWIHTARELNPPEVYQRWVNTL